MSESMINLWINSETNALLPNWNAFGTATLPQIKQGDTIEFDIHWVKSDPAGQFMEEVVIPPLSVIKVAVGNPNGGPTGGHFVYNFLGDTVQIPYNATDSEANTLINGLPSIISAGGVVVTLVNQRTFRIVFNEVGARAISSCDSTPLSPSTVISVIRINAGGPTTKEVQHLRPKLLPVAYSDSFTNSPQPVISINDIDSITKRISISPAPKFGTFTISNGTGTTSALSINSSAGDVLKGLTDSGISSATRTYSVAKSGDYSWDIYRTSGTSETLTITTTGLIGFSSKTGTVSFNTLEVEDLLAGQPSVSATLEVEYSYGDVRQTLYQGRVTIANDIIEESTYNPIPFPELQAGIEEAPTDGVLYGRKDGIWSAVVGDGNNIPDYDNTLTYTVGNQVYYQGKLYRMIVAVGGAGYDPVGHPSYWESLSGSNPDLSGLRPLTDYDFTNVSSKLTTFGLTLTPPAGTVEPYDSFIDSLVVKQSYDASQGGVQTGWQQEATHTISGVSVRFREWVDNDGTIEPTAGQSVTLSSNTLRFGDWNFGVNNTMWYGSGNIRFPNATTQSTAFLGYDSPSFTGNVSITTGVTPNPALVINYSGTGDVIQFKDSINDTTYSFIDGSGKVNTIASTTDNAGLRIPHGAAPAAPVNGDIWTTTSGLFARINGISQQYITSASFSDYALLSGATFTGKVNHTSVGGLAGVNIGIGGTSTNATVAGDLWIGTGGTNLNFRDGSGAWRVVATQGQTNSFSTNQIISGSTTSAMLRVTQTGTGEALRIEDETNPDATPFIVGSDGRVGIHGTPAVDTNHKLAIYNGNIVFSSGFGLAFGDGTTQTTAATGNVSTGVTNTFTTNQIIAGTTTSPTLRITQSGTGDALRVQDVANDTSAFVIDKDGLVGINGEPHGGTYYPLTINDGDLRFRGSTGLQASGITFTDGSRLSSAAGVGATKFFEMTDVNWDSSFATPDTDGSFPVIRVTNLGEKVVEFVPSYYWNGNVSMLPHISTYSTNSGDPNTSLTITMTVTFHKPILALHTGLISVQLVSSANTHIYASNSSPYYGTNGGYYGKNLVIRISEGEQIDGWAYNDPDGCFSVSVSAVDGNGSSITSSWSDQFAGSSVNLGGDYRAYVEQTTSPYYDRPVTERGFQNALTLFLLQQNALPEPTATPRKLALTLDEASQLWSMTPRNVFTEKVSLPSVTTTSASLNIGAGSVNPSNPIAGDIWLNGDTLFYRSGSSNLEVASRNANNVYTGTQIIDLSSASTAVRITQRGTGSALIVEDSTTPDSTSFIVNANGVVGIQRTNGWSPSAGVFLDVGGKGMFTATASFAGINIGVQTTAPTSTIAGDVWVGTNNIFFKDSTNAQRTVPALNLANVFASNQVVAAATTGALLRITQTGTGNALVVEDTNNPDTTSFVIDASGNVGIGVTPSGWVATQKLELQGNIKFSDNSIQSTAYVPSAVAITGGTIDNIIIDGGTF